MKNLIRMWAVSALMITFACIPACKNYNDNKNNEPPYQVSTFLYDGCEYIYMHKNNRLGIAHKGNCGNHLIKR